MYLKTVILLLSFFSELNTLGSFYHSLSSSISSAATILVLFLSIKAYTSKLVSRLIHSDPLHLLHAISFPRHPPLQSTTVPFVRPTLSFCHHLFILFLQSRCLSHSWCLGNSSSSFKTGLIYYFSEAFLVPFSLPWGELLVVLSVLLLCYPEQ